MASFTWIHDVKVPEQTTPNLLGKKMGKGCCESFLGAYARGDCSIETAAREANVGARSTKARWTRGPLFWYPPLSIDCLTTCRKA
jgi:hypothetical protein